MAMEALPTVLVPGLLCSARLFSTVVPALWPRGAVTIADTLRDDTLGGMADRLLAGAPPRFALVGLSMGGYVAFEVLRRSPERVARLALVGTSARPDTPEQTEGRLAQIAMARTGRFDELIDMVFPALVAPARRDDARLRDAFAEMAGEVGPEAFERQQQAIIARADARPQLASVGCPTVVVHGDRDHLIPHAHGAEIAAGIPGAELVTVPGCGHLSTLEDPEPVAAAL